MSKLETYGFVILLLIIGVILILYLKKEQRVNERSSNMIMNSYQKNGFVEAEDDKTLFFEGLHIPEYLKENDFNIETFINETKLYKKGDCKVIDLDFVKLDKRNKPICRIGGSFFTKKLDFKIDKQLFFRFDIDDYIKVNKMKYYLDFDSEDQEAFKSKCEELANEKFVEFMFYVDNDVLEVYVDERIKQEKLNDFANISKMGMENRVECMTEYFIKIVDDVESLLKGEF